MQRGLQDTDRETNHKVLLMGGSIVFTFLLFFAVGVMILSQTGLKNFYSKKTEVVGRTSFATIMPAEQETGKMLRILKSMEPEDLNSKEGILVKDASLNLNKVVNTNLVFCPMEDKLHVALSGKGQEAAKKGNGIVLPYKLHSYYGVSLNQKLEIQVNQKSYTYVVVGFYEDEIMSQQDLSKRLFVYIDEENYTAWSQQENVVKEVIYEVRLQQEEQSQKVVSELQEKLQEELFIGGLDLEVINGNEIEETVTEYIQYARLVCLVLGSIFGLIALVGELLFLKNYLKNSNLEDKKQRILFYSLEGGKALGGILVLLFAGEPLLDWMISSSGYRFQASSLGGCILLSLLIYLILETVLVVVSERMNKNKAAVKLGQEMQTTNRKQFHMREFIILAGLSFVLATGTILVTQIYSNTCGVSDLYYQYDNDEDVIEVFHSSSTQIGEANPFDELIEDAKPILKTSVIGIVIAMGILYALIVWSMADKITRRLYQKGEKNPRERSLTILGYCLLATLLGFLMAVLVSILCIGPVMAMVTEALGIVVQGVRMNYLLCLMLFGGTAIIAGGVILAKVH